MNNSLIVDILYPSKFSRWRNLEINFFIEEFKSDILVYKIDGFAGIDFECDFEFAYSNSNLNLQNYNILIFNPNYNYLNKYNKNIDGTLFNNKFNGSYLITKNTEFNLNNYSFIYHIFLMCYFKFNNHYVFDYNKQLIHLYPGGGFTGHPFDLTRINKNVKLISTSPLTTKLLEQSNEHDFTEIKIGPMFNKDEKIKTKNLNDGQLIICFSSLGNGTEKGDDKYINIINEYKLKYPTDNVKFISIGNCKRHHNIINYPPMDYIELQSFYYDNVDIYLNLETGKSFNGWPLGMEALKSGSVLITTDSLNVSGFYDLQSNPFYITNNLNEYVDIIKLLYIDRNLLLSKSKEGQKFVEKYSSYENQQEKIKEYINKKIL